MFINPMTAIKEGWMKGVLEDHVEPNAVDIRLEKIWKVDETTEFSLYQEGKEHRRRTEVESTTIVHEGMKVAQDMWTLERGIYDFMSPAYVEMPEGTVGWLVTRSTLNRNGVFVLSGLYDSGYEGHINGMLYVRGGTMMMEKMSRGAQFIVGSSDSFGTYSGGYNTIEGSIPEYFNESQSNE